MIFKRLKSKKVVSVNDHISIPDLSIGKYGCLNFPV